MTNSARFKKKTQNAILHKRLLEISGRLAALEENPRRRRHVLERITCFLEEWWLIRMIVVLGIIFGIGAVGIYYEEWKDRKAERVARAWGALSNDVAGNTGKADAIEYLVENGIDLIGLQLVSPSEDSGAFLANLTLSNETIRRSRFKYTEFEGARLEAIHFDGGSFQDVTMQGSLLGTEFDRVAMNNSEILLERDSRVSFLNSYLQNVEIAPASGVLNEFSSSVNRQLALALANRLQKIMEDYPDADLNSILDLFHEQKQDEEFFASFLNLIKNEAYREALVKGDYDALAYELNGNGVILSIRASSLRCSKIIVDNFTSFELIDSNLSGATLGYGESPLSEKLPHRFSGSFYFEDTPPTGLSEDTLASLYKIRREDFLNICEHSIELGQQLPSGIRIPRGLCVDAMERPERCSRVLN